MGNPARQRGEDGNPVQVRFQRHQRPGNGRAHAGVTVTQPWIAPDGGSFHRGRPVLTPSLSGERYLGRGFSVYGVVSHPIPLDRRHTFAPKFDSGIIYQCTHKKN